MNKKFFAALMASGMLMGSPMGVLAAEEMVEVENGSVPGTDVEQASTVKLDDVNFPDDNFRKAVATAYANVGNEGDPKEAVADGTSLKTNTLAEITSLASTAGDPIDTANTPIKDLTGIEYLTGLEVLNLQYSPNLKVADLSDNEELVTVVIAPAEGGITNVTADKAPEITTPADAESSDLYSITLPEETANLEYLVIEGAPQLTALDLSAYDSLTFVDLQNNELAQLNVSGTSIEDLNVSGNDLTGLDVSSLKSLATLTATDNNLYELELPSGKTLTTIDVSDNKLPSIDVSSLRSLETLNVSDNRLESIDLSSNTTVKNLNVAYNHLAVLDLSDNTTLAGATTAFGVADDAAGGADAKAGDDPTLTVSPQYLYANTTDEGIDLASYDENFQADSSDLGWLANPTEDGATDVNIIGGEITKAGVFEFGSDVTPTKENSGIGYNYAIGAAAAKAEDADGDAGEADAEALTKSNNVMSVYIVQADLMNRLYNPNSGEHFYTKDTNEKDTLVKLGWQYEGIGWVAPQENYPTVPVEASAAVFRLYNPNAGDHHYTKDSKEKDTLVRAGWNYEGVGWYSAKDHAHGEDDAGTVTAYSIEVYREYNPNAKEAGAHNYTVSENENDTLVALGWLDEGIGWWALK